MTSSDQDIGTVPVRVADRPVGPSVVRMQLNVARPAMDFLEKRVQQRGIPFTTSVADALTLLQLADEIRAAGGEFGVRWPDGEFRPVRFLQP